MIPLTVTRADGSRVQIGYYPELLDHDFDPPRRNLQRVLTRTVAVLGDLLQRGA